MVGLPWVFVSGELLHMVVLEITWACTNETDMKKRVSGQIAKRTERKEIVPPLEHFWFLVCGGRKLNPKEELKNEKDHFDPMPLAFRRHQLPNCSHINTCSANRNNCSHGDSCSAYSYSRSAHSHNAAISNRDRFANGNAQTTRDGHYVDISVPDLQRVYLKDLFDMARREMGDAGDVSVFVSYDMSRLPPTSGLDWNDYLTVSYPGGRIAVNGRNLERNLGSPESLKSMLVSYYFLVEANLSGNKTDSSPQWLVYGSANYIAFSTFDRAGKYSYAEARKNRAPFALKAVNSGSTLKVLESNPGARQGDLGPVGFIAVEMLANIAGEASINKYWTALGKASWQTAFEQAFGIKVDDFYARFDGWREKGFEPGLKPKQ